MSVKITELTAATDVVDADLVPVVDDVAGTPVTKKSAFSLVWNWILTKCAAAVVNFTGISIGSTPHASALIRLPYAASDIAIGAPNSVGTDTGVLHRPAANTWRFGDATVWNIGVYGVATNLYGSSVLAIFNNAGSDYTLFVQSDNLSMHGQGNYGGGVKVTHITNASTVPTTNPTGGGLLYAEGGALKWRGSSGTVTTIAPA